MMKKNLFFLIVAFFMVLTLNAQTDAKTKTANSNSTTVVQENPKSITYLIQEPLDLVSDADTIALHNRGWKNYYRSIPLGTTRFYAGITTVFTAHSGTGYAAENYSNTSGTGTIDTWLVSPKLSIAVGDSLSFWERSPDGSTFPDYLMIMYNAAGDSLPSAASWTTLVPAFQTSTAGWFNKKVRFTAAGSPQARFAIRYYVTNGGPSGANSDYVGLDEISVYRNSVGISEMKKSTISVYPNPVSSNVLNVNFDGNAQIIIYNALGAMVYNKASQSVNGTIGIDINTFNAGNYFIQVINNNGNYSQKFTVIK